MFLGGVTEELVLACSVGPVKHIYIHEFCVAELTTVP